MYLDNKTQPPNSTNKEVEVGEGVTKSEWEREREATGRAGIGAYCSNKKDGVGGEVEGVGALPDFTPLL